MADFPKEYFLSETRDGFFIEAMMKCAWAAEIEVLEVLDHVCSKHGIRYFAAYGTLLGTVRHKGFIPWDDDVDIFMLREDYERLLRLPAGIWPSGFVLHSIYENNIHSQPFARICNSPKIDYSPKHLSRFHGCPYVVGADIFPLDTLSQDISETDTQCELLKILYQVSRLCDEAPESALELLPDIESLCNIHFDREHYLKNQLLRAAESLCQLYNNTSGTEITDFTGRPQNDLRMKKEWFSDAIRMPFENITLPVPICYHEILTAIYGDWKTPVQGIADHDYPFYKKQDTILAECLLQERNSPT